MKVFGTLVFLMVSTTTFGQAQNLSQLVYETRNPETDSARFRKVVKKIGEYLALDIQEELETQETAVETLTGAFAKHQVISETPVLVTILRAGLPLCAGVHKVFPNAEVGFLGMSRNEETLKASTTYIALPNIENKTVILIDTMLATGGSMIDALNIIKQRNPKKIIVVTAIASVPGIDRVLQYDPSVRIFSAAVDPSLNEKGFIIPGLGDAGDRCYGVKHITQ